MRNVTAENSSPPHEVLRHPAFAYLWSASTIRAFGTAIAGVGFQILIVKVLQATPSQISVLSALSVVPYLFLGFVVGAWMDRWRRQRALMWTTIGRAITLAIVPVLILTDTLSFWSLAAVMLMLGTLTLFSDSAAQPLLPRILPRSRLVQANARLSQSETVASTAGPALGGALFTLVGAPILFLIDALLNACAAILQSRIRIAEPRTRRKDHGSSIWADIAEGMRFAYTHRTLRPLAFSIHVWFLGNSLVITAFGVYVLRALALPEWAFGLVMAAGGIGGFFGALIAPRIGGWLGTGRAIALGRIIVVLPWAVLGLLPLTAQSGVMFVLLVTALVQFIYALGMGIEDANDIAYRQSVTPDGMQGRLNSTIRTVNRIVFFAGALLAGVLMVNFGDRATIAIGAAVFAVAAAIALFSQVRHAQHGDAETSSATEPG